MPLSTTQTRTPAPSEPNAQSRDTGCGHRAATRLRFAASASSAQAGISSSTPRSYGTRRSPPPLSRRLEQAGVAVADRAVEPARPSALGVEVGELAGRPGDAAAVLVDHPGLQ